MTSSGAGPKRTRNTPPEANTASGGSRWHRPPGIIAAYESEPWSTRAHTMVRWASIPMETVQQELPSSGEVLEIGCGHGLFSLTAALGSHDRRIIGTDIDGAKLVEARRAAQAAGLGQDQLEFIQVEPDWRPPVNHLYGAVVIIDVLYLLGIAAALDLTAAAARVVQPGGTLLIKEMDTSLRAKSAWCSTQELISTKLTRVTEGETVELVPLDAIRTVMQEAGLEVTTRALDRHYVHPHALLIGQRR
jgi:cyclopropane fatty-acyl-phospholipid synthase-like methyltransferase